MAKILDKDKNAVIIKLTITEYQQIKKLNLIEDDFSDYELVFDKPILAKNLLKAF